VRWSRTLKVNGVVGTRDVVKCEVPVLLGIFKRPSHTRSVVEALKQAKPVRLFVAADGPRFGCNEDIERCRLARQAATEVDWPCEVKTRFLQENVGCGPGVSPGISWFFEHVEYGIILEDDCVPHPHFFPFCGELFDRYASDERIMRISGLSPYPARAYPYDLPFQPQISLFRMGNVAPCVEAFFLRVGSN
jgi:hypothetical protein